MQEENISEYRFAVVKFIELPHAGIDDYMCIPHSWIRLYKVKDRLSIVALPYEHPSTTTRRVVNGEKPSDRWRLYQAVIKYETNSYTDANKYIMTKKYDVLSASRYTAVTSIDHTLLQAATPERDSPSRKRTNWLEPITQLNKNKVTVNKTREVNTNLSSNKQLNIESVTFPSWDPLNNVSQYEMTKAVDLRSLSFQEQFPHQFTKNTTSGSSSNQPQNRLLSEKNLLPGHLNFPSVLEKHNESQVNNPGTGDKAIASNAFRPSQNQFILENKIFYGFHPVQDSYTDANKYIMTKKYDVLSASRYTAVTSIDHTLLQAATPERDSPSRKRTNWLEPITQLNKNKVTVNKTREVNTNLSSNKQLNIESVTFPSWDPLNNVSQYEMTKAVDLRSLSFQEQFPHQFTKNTTSGSSSNQPQNRLLSEKNLLPGHLNFPSVLEKHNESQVNNPGTGDKAIASNAFRPSQNQFILENKIFYGFHPVQGKQPSIHGYLQHTALIQGTSEISIPNFQAIPDISQHQDFRPSSSFCIQNPSSIASQFINCMPSSYSGTMNVSAGSAKQCDFSTQFTPGDVSHCPKNAGLEKSIVNESSAVSYIEQSVSSEPTTEKESCQLDESTENLLHIENVSADNVSLTQDFVCDEGEQSRSLEETSTAGQSAFKKSDQKMDSATSSAEYFVDNLGDLFQKMKSNMLATCQMADDLHKSFVKSGKLLGCIADASENLRKLKNSKTVVLTQEEVQIEAQKVATEEEIEIKQKENFDVEMKEVEKKTKKKDKKSKKNTKSSRREFKRREDANTDASNKSSENEDKDEEATKKIHGHTCSLVLPPEYDRNDSRWTLKYRRTKLGLEELVPQSNVFVNSIRLKHCQQVAKDCKTLVWMLLMEVFSQQALSVCSLTGARANVFDINGTRVRPGLDEHARMVIMSFVEDHARQKNWGVFDLLSVANSIRNKLQEIRAKHGQTA